MKQQENLEINKNINRAFKFLTFQFIFQKEFNNGKRSLSDLMNVGLYISFLEDLMQQPWPRTWRQILTLDLFNLN